MLKNYLIVVLGSLFYCYEFFIRVSPSAITDDLMLHFNVHASGLALMSAAFFYAYMPMQMFAGFIGDKFGVRKTLTVCIGLCSLATLLFVFSQNIWWATTARFLMGLSASFAYVGPLMLANAWLDKKYYAASAGLVQVLGSFGAFLVGSELSARTLQTNWQETYYILAIIGFILMIIIYLFVRNTPKDHDIDSSESKIAIIPAIKELLSKRKVWFIAFAGFAFWAPMSIFSELWGAKFLHQHEHISIVLANSQMRFMWIGVALGGPIWGWISFYNRLLVMKFAYTLLFVVASVLLYKEGASLFVTDILLFLFGFACSAQCISFGLIRDYQGKHLIGTAVGFNNMFVILGGAVLQPLSGVLIDYFDKFTNITHLMSMQFTFFMIPIISLFGLYIVQFQLGKIGSCK